MDSSIEEDDLPEPPPNRKKRTTNKTEIKKVSIIETPQPLTQVAPKSANRLFVDFVEVELESMPVDQQLKLRNLIFMFCMRQNPLTCDSILRHLNK